MRERQEMIDRQKKVIAERIVQTEREEKLRRRLTSDADTNPAYLGITFNDVGKKIEIQKPNVDRIRVKNHEYIDPPINQDNEVEDIVETTEVYKSAFD